MTCTKYIFLVFVIAMTFSSCEKKESTEFTGMIDTWEFVSSSGGFAGSGFEKTYNQLIIDDNHNWKATWDGILVASGDLVQLSSDEDNIRVMFDGTSVDPDVYIDLISDGEKFVDFVDGEMHLLSDCCDRYDHLYK